MELKSNNLKFKTTEKCFDKIAKIISKDSYESGGAIFEDFTSLYHIYTNPNYVDVWNTNQIDTIPDYVKADLGDKLFNRLSAISNGKTNFYGIDKIFKRRDGKYDFHQDKAHKSRDKNEAIKQVEGMCTLAYLSNKQCPDMIEDLVLNSMADDITDMAGVVAEYGNLITYHYADFCPNPDVAERVNEDIEFWKWIRKSIRKDTIVDKASSFRYRNHVQKDYEDSVIVGYHKQVAQKGRFKGFSLAVGATGKSVLDPRLLAMIEKDHLDQDTKDQFEDIGFKLSVGYWHSSETLPNNGYEFTKRRREIGLNDYVIVVSGTSINDKDALQSQTTTTKFPQVTVGDPERIEDLIYQIERGKKLGYKHIILKGLYHHSEIVYNVEQYYKNKDANFEFFFVYRDECDWPSKGDSRYAYAFKHKSHIAFGSTGTETKGSKYTLATERMSVHGPKVFDYRWTQAEIDKLVKPLRLVCPTLLMSELVKTLPDLVNKKGEIDLLKKVKGNGFIDIDGTYPTVEFIIQLVTTALGMYSEPKANRNLCFAGRVKTNKMAELNWKNVCDKVLPNTKLAREIKDTHWEVLNDETLSKATIKDRTKRIARAKKHSRYIIASCRLLNRGYNDKEKYNGIARLKHNSGFHLSDKTQRDQAQEIWRFIRLDTRTLAEHGIQDPDPYSYYIAPVIVNDINEKNSHYMDTNMTRVLNVLMGNRRIFDEIIQAGSGSSRGKRKKPDNTIPVFANLDLSNLPSLVSHLKRMSNGRFVHEIANEAHTWIITEYMKLPNPGRQACRELQKDIWDRFYNIKEFEPMWLNIENIKLWEQDFFHGTRKYSPRGSQNYVITDNVLAWKQHQEDFYTWLNSTELKNKVIDIATVWFDNDFKAYSHNKLAEGLHTHIDEEVPEFKLIHNAFVRSKVINPAIDKLKKNQLTRFEDSEGYNTKVLEFLFNELLCFAKDKDYKSIGVFIEDFCKHYNDIKPKRTRNLSAGTFKPAFYFDKTWHKVIDKSLVKKVEEVFERVTHKDKWASQEEEILRVAKKAIANKKDYVEALVNAGFYPEETLKTRRIDRKSLLKIRKLFTKDYQEKVLDPIKTKNVSDVQKTVVVDLEKKWIFPHTVDMVSYYSKIKGKQLEKGFANDRLNRSKKNPNSSFYGRYIKFPVKGQDLSYTELFNTVKQKYNKFTVIS